MKAIRLRTEYLVNPLGMDLQQPRLFWNCQDGIKQTAYQVISEQWDSGKVESNSMRAEWGGQPCPRKNEGAVEGASLG